MILEARVFPAQEILRVEVVPHGRAGVWFLNWSIGAKTPQPGGRSGMNDLFCGAGLYGICFDERLIYVGSYLGVGRGGAFLTGNVVEQRWWAHIGSMVARGNRVHIAPTSLRALQEDPGSQHRLVAGLLEAKDPQQLHTDQGDLATLRRLRFAVRNSDAFLDRGASPDEVLKRFTFTYARFLELPTGLSHKILADRIETAEKNLIVRLAPECNSKHVPKGKAAAEVPCSRLGAMLKEELGST